MGTLIKSISGIRGIVGDGLDPEILVKFSLAFAEFCGYGKIIVGRDSRITGNFINKIVCGTLQSAGCEVIDIGIVPTPTVQLYVEKEKANGGIAITASHNPNEWNALKLLNSNGMFLNIEEANNFFELESKLVPRFKKWNDIGSYKKIEKAFTYHIDELMKIKYFDVDLIRSKKFNVLVDCVNGAGIEVVPELLSLLGCNVTKINCDSTGIFPRNPEPLPENLTETINFARANKFDLTIIVDPDVDRLVLLTDEGEPFIEENTIVLATKFILSKNPGIVCVNFSTTRAVEDIAQEYNSKVVRTPVGEINVATKMKELNAIIGGEGSGGVILPDLHYGRDALAGILITLQFLAETGKSLSEIKKELPQYFILKDKFVMSSEVNPDKVIDKFKSKITDGIMNEEDGLRIDFPDYWVHLRRSNTEPIIRLIIEANTVNKVKQLMEKYKTMLADSLQKSFS